uniref:Tetratricopeptide repeat protein n=1 Tax=Panagrolaimus superbus TaxID=310955 RepID=A0A914Z0Z6_9BILA
MGKYNVALYFLGKAKEKKQKVTEEEILKAECSIYEKFPDHITKDKISLFDAVISDEKTSDARRAQTAFLNVKDELAQKQHLYGTLLFQNKPEFDQLAFEHAIRFGCDDLNILRNLYTRIVYDFIKDGKLSPSFENASKAENFVLQNKVTSDWLSLLFANNFADAYDSLSKVPSNEYHFWPFCGLAFYTYFATRQFDKVIKLYRSNITAFPDENIFKVLELEAIFENYADEIELKQILRSFENFSVKDDKKVIEIKLRIKILLGICDENEINGSELESATKNGLLAELHFTLKNYLDARNAGEQCLKLSTKKQWRSELILAKLKWILDKDFDAAENDLQRLYAENPFVADILAALSEFYVALEEYDTAQHLIGHAIYVNPSNKAFREIQDNIFAILNIAVEDRIRKLNQYIALKPYSMWAVKHVTVLEVQSGRYEEAVSKLRRVIHALPDDVDIEVRKSAAAIWAYVGLINLHRGHAKSTMYAFESAVSLEPENPNFLLQLALAQKRLYKYEEVFGTLEKLHSVESSPEILKHAHLVLLDSLSFYAAQLEPGERQIRQLFTLFDIVGNMSVHEWRASQALLFSIANGLSLLRKYNNDIVDALLSEIPHFFEKCGITKKEDILNAEIAIMLALLSVDPNIGSINETAVRLMTYTIENNSQKVVANARRFFRKAILISSQKPNIRSTLYLNFALTFCIGTVDFEKALHFCLRSLQLNKNNPSALSLIGFLCLHMNNIQNATQAFNAAHILEPSQIEHWYGRAMLAQLQTEPNEIEVLNNFQHSLSIKPCLQAVEVFSYYLAKEKAAGRKMDKFDFDFTSVRHLLYVNEQSDRLLYSMATFAEHFHHFDEAAFLIDKVSSVLNVSKATKIRMLIPSQTFSKPLFSHDGLERLYKIYHGTLSEAVAFSGFRAVILIDFLLRPLANDSWHIFWKFYRARLFPILVGFIHVLEMVKLF